MGAGDTDPGSRSGRAAGDMEVNRERRYFSILVRTLKAINRMREDGSGKVPPEK